MENELSKNTRTLIYRLLKAYNAGDDSVFEKHVSSKLPWKLKVLDEIRSRRSGQVDTLDVIVDGSDAAEYWVERGMQREGEIQSEVWGVNFYKIIDDVVVQFFQVEEFRNSV